VNADEVKRRIEDLIREAYALGREVGRREVFAAATKVIRTPKWPSNRLVRERKQLRWEEKL
jgi:hypothetical protein